jgi:hypothetical protein
LATAYASRTSESCYDHTCFNIHLFRFKRVAFPTVRDHDRGMPANMHIRVLRCIHNSVHDYARKSVRGTAAVKLSTFLTLVCMQDEL